MPINAQSLHSRVGIVADEIIRYTKKSLVLAATAEESHLRLSIDTDNGID